MASAWAQTTLLPSMAQFFTHCLDRQKLMAKIFARGGQQRTSHCKAAPTNPSGTEPARNRHAVETSEVLRTVPDAANRDRQRIYG